MSSPIAGLGCQPMMRRTIDKAGNVIWRTVKFEALDPTGANPNDPDGSYEHDLAVTEAACGLAKRWDLDFSVNVYPWFLETPGFPQDVLESVAHCGFDHRRITLELLETGLINPDDEQTRINLAIFCGTGFNFGLDDIGSPGSHVATRKQVERLLRDYQRPSWQLTLRTLKIDRSLLVRSRSRRHRLLEFLELAAGREVVFEGVETAADLEYLLGLVPADINALFQGYYFARPLTPDKFEERLREERLRIENEAVLVTT